uniref:Ig-like domain-containing protein n=1 Tax=Heterorhabditis bacteriophora TaxID=37862 RepID=A0A1I7WMF7_HETBA
MPTHRVWKVVLRSTVELNCDVEAAPEPVVRWVDADDRPLQIVEGKTKVLPNHTFVIYDVNTADEGLYYCNVSNKYGINRATNKLQVFKPTFFVKIPSPKRLSIEAGESAELFCEAVADPRLTVDYKWTLNGQIINQSSTFEILPDRLRVRSARGRNSGIIDCAAITDVDVKLASMQLIVKDVPENPPVEPIMCSERKAVIRWKPANEHGDEIKKYTVEMHTDFRKASHISS